MPPQSPPNPEGLFALASHIDATSDGIYAHSPVTTSFDGVFEGLGHRISHLTINSPNDEYVGLFSTVFFDGVVANLRLNYVDISAGTGQAGALAGTVNGAIVNVHSAGRMQAGTGAAGGLIGYLYSNTSVTLCSSAVSVNATGGTAAGLIAAGFFANVSQSFATGPVKAKYAGGAFGFFSKSVVTDTYATGSVTAPAGARLGGLLSGIGNSTVATSYSAGRVTASAPQDVGGLMGEYDGSVPPYGSTLTDNYWDVTTSVQTAATASGTPSGTTGLTSAQLQSGVPAGFNTGIWSSDPNINNGFPYLLANPPLVLAPK